VRRVKRRAAVLSLSLAAAAGAQHVVPVASTAALRDALRAAAPGTTIALAPGDYDGFHASDVAATAAQPITLRAADRERPPRFRGGVHFSDVAHVVLEDLLLERTPANGLNVDDGGTFATPSHHVVLRRLVVRDCGGRGNDDGIKLSGVDDVAIEDCTVERWGRTGSAIDMVGCHRGVVVRCTFRDRADEPAANGVQLKGGTRDVAVRECRFEHAGQRAVQLGGSTGRAFFRPKPEGFEAKDLLVERCTFVGSLAPIAFVGCDGAVVQHNTIWLPRKWVLRVLQETREPDFVPCRSAVFRDNLIVYRGLDPVVNVGPGTAPATFTFANNWWFRADDPARSVPRLPVAEVGPAGGSEPRFVDAANGDLRQRPDSPAKGHGADVATVAPTRR
jgi:hypothetical protein